MLIQLAWFAAGLVALIAGADLLVRGASRLALSWGISPLVIGLTIVAFGTSAPEVAVSTGAVLSGQTDIAVGNVVGSNIFNVLFILGLSALIVPLAVNQQLIRQEVPIMLGAGLILLVLGFDGIIDRQDGAWLLGLMIAYTLFLVVQSRQETAASPEFNEAFGRDGKPKRHSAWPLQIGFIGAGLALLVLGSGWLVDACVHFARAFGVSELVIGLTVVAAGTSMPEVATSITAAFKGERDIAVGNVVGSNTFNILGCLGLSGLVSGSAGLPMAESVMGFDIWVMLAVMLACLPIFLSGREIARWEGGLFLAYYVFYVAYLIIQAVQHDTLPWFSVAMTAFVIPLTIVTLIVSVIKNQRN